MWPTRPYKLNSTLLVSAKVRSGTIVVMQKLARTESAAKNPMQLTQSMITHYRFDSFARAEGSLVAAINEPSWRAAALLSGADARPPVAIPTAIKMQTS